MIDHSTLPSWPAIFRQIGEREPRRKRARCPIHDGDSPTSLSINEDKGVYFCHVCHASGDKLDFVQRVLKIDFKGALGFLGISAERHFYKSPPAMTHEQIALSKLRQWCADTGRTLRDEHLTRQRIAEYSREKLSIDEESLLGWELLRIAAEGEMQLEFLLDEIDLCRTDSERLDAWRTYRHVYD